MEEVYQRLDETSDADLRAMVLTLRGALCVQLGKDNDAEANFEEVGLHAAAPWMAPANST